MNAILKELPGRRYRRCFLFTLGPRAPFIQTLPRRMAMTLYQWEGREKPIPKRNLNDLPFVSINFRKGHSSCFSRRTHILFSEGDTLGWTFSILRIHPFL